MGVRISASICKIAMVSKSLRKVSEKLTLSVRLRDVKREANDVEIVLNREGEITVDLRDQKSTRSSL